MLGPLNRFTVLTPLKFVGFTQGDTASLPTIIVDFEKHLRTHVLLFALLFVGETDLGARYFGPD